VVLGPPPQLLSLVRHPRCWHAGDVGLAILPREGIIHLRQPDCSVWNPIHRGLRCICTPSHIHSLTFQLDAKILQKYRQYGPGNPPRSFLVRPKADAYIRDIASDMGYDSDDDVRNRERIRANARDKYIDETRSSVRSNLRSYGLPDQRVYLISKSNISKLVNGQSAPTQIDETDLLTNLGLLPQ